MKPLARVFLAAMAALMLGGCLFSGSPPTPAAEQATYDEVLASIFEGMRMSDLFDLTDRRPIFLGTGIDNDTLVYEFLTPGEGGANYRRLEVDVDRHTKTVVAWR